MHFSGAWESKLFPYDAATDSYSYGGDGVGTASTGLKLQDFSYAGYKESEAAIPNVAVKVTVSPGGNIQNALNQLAKLSKDSNGFRGALLIKAGTYTITEPIVVPADGIVVRGEGPTKTFIYVNSNNYIGKAAISVRGPGNGFLATGNSEYHLLADLKIGDRSARVQNASSYFKAGDEVVFSHLRNSTFLKDHAMDGVKTWPNDGAVLTTYVTVQSVSGDTINFKEPMTYKLRTAWGSKVSKITKQWRQVGIEDLAIGFKPGTGPGRDITFLNEPPAPTHNARAIEISRVTDAWVSNVKSYAPSSSSIFHLQSKGIVLTDVKSATIESCSMQHAYNQGQGGNGYMYEVVRCNDVLIKDCYAKDGRHNFCINGSSSRIVLAHFTSDTSTIVQDCHKYLTRGLLIDSCTINTKSSDFIQFKNRLTQSSGAGYTATEVVLWNCEGKGGAKMLVWMNNFGQSYVIGSHGSVYNVNLISDVHTKCFMENVGRAGLLPSSLFSMQLQMRLKKNPENEKPTVEITSPVNGSTITGPTNVTITASARDVDGSIAKVEFYKGSTLISADTSAPYSATLLNVSTGTYTVSAKAFDNKGAATTSSSVAFTVGSTQSKPTVTLTSPKTGEAFNYATSVPLAALASEQNGTITKVEFYANDKLIQTELTPPYEKSWNPSTAGSYVIKAKAYDQAGQSVGSSSATITVKAENLKPTVTLTAPLGGTSLTSPATINLSAKAVDSDGTISKVEFYANDKLVKTEISAPYETSWSTSVAATYVIKAIAYDNAGASTTSSTASVTVKAANISPTVTLISPKSGASYSNPAAIPLTANAGDADGSIAKVEFYANGNLIKTELASPYTTTWSTKIAGTYDIKAIAYDDKGATTSSSTAKVTVQAPLAVNILPTVNITSPVNGQIIESIDGVKVSANATDKDGTIKKIEFFANGTLIGTQIDYPYWFNWNPVPGSYQIKAKAYDETGAMAESAAVNLMVTRAKALFVSESETLNPSDAALKARLENLGFDVSVKGALESNSDDSAGKRLVVISSVSISRNIGMKFRDVKVPVVTWESHLLDDLGMAGLEPRVDYYTLPEQSKITVTNNAHPLAAGLNGDVTVYQSPGKISWGKPNGNAIKVANVSGQPDLSLLFAYDTGSVMNGLVAPARRVFLFLEDNEGTSLTIEGQKLFDQSVIWAAAK